MTWQSCESHVYRENVFCAIWSDTRFQPLPTPFSLPHVTCLFPCVECGEYCGVSNKRIGRLLHNSHVYIYMACNLLLLGKSHFFESKCLPINSFHLFFNLFLTEEAYSHSTTPDKEVWPSPFKCQPAPIWTLNLVQIVLEQTLRLVEIFVVWSYLSD